MEQQAAVTRFRQAAELLEGKWQRGLRRLSEEQMALCEEIRLRAGRQMTVLLPEGEMAPDADSPVVTHQDLERLCDMLTAYSRYASAEAMGRGYLQTKGGFRVGLCGTAVLREGSVANLRDISSASLRIGREVKGVAGPILNELMPDGTLPGTLLLSGPGGGKTTLLRDMIRCLSDGQEGRTPLRVALADERGEIAAMYQGLPQLDVGAHTDVLDGCPKAMAIPMLLRSMNPQVLAVDEITETEDIRAIVSAANCGVTMLATIHAADVAELQRKPLFRRLLQAKVFAKAVMIQRREGQRHYLVEDLA